MHVCQRGRKRPRERQKQRYRCMCVCMCRIMLIILYHNLLEINFSSVEFFLFFFRIISKYFQWDQNWIVCKVKVHQEQEKKSLFFFCSFYRPIINQSCGSNKAPHSRMRQTSFFRHCIDFIREMLPSSSASAKKFTSLAWYDGQPFIFFFP